MFTWLFHVVDDNYKERPHKFTDEEIKEYMTRYDIDNDEFKEIIENLLEYENYYIKEGELFLKDNINGKEYKIKCNEDNTYNFCDNCMEIIDLNNESSQEHLEHCLRDEKYDKEIYISEEVMARTMPKAIEKISDYLKENLPVPEDDKWNLSLSCAENNPCWDGGTIDFDIKNVKGHELRMIFNRPDYSSEEFESWDEEELDEFKMEIEKVGRSYGRGY